MASMLNKLQPQKLTGGKSGNNTTQHKQTAGPTTGADPSPLNLMILDVIICATINCINHFNTLITIVHASTSL